VYDGKGDSITVSVVAHLLEQNLMVEYSAIITGSTHCAALTAVSSTRAMFLTFSDATTYNLYLVEFGTELQTVSR